ncbi:hypothetical protein Godav_004020, partial [Gossypium davidsonii]|nr:hypothetical protein [Gossypium davidsonii]
MEIVRLKCGFSNGINIGAVGSKGGLSLGWNGNDLVSIKSYSFSHIDAMILDPDNGMEWRLTGFYGCPDIRFRTVSWDLLRRLGQDQDVPWMVIGDFNEILSSFEKKGGRLRSARQMGEFRSVLEDCSLYDVGYNGRWFTWERGRFLSSNLRERFDREVANLAWLSLYPNFSLDHLNYSFSDHCPLLLNTMGRVLYKINRSSSPFRFEAKWFLDDAFEEVVKRGWKDHQDPTDEILGEIMEVQLGLNFEADKEEVYWAQRTRLNWLQYGDRNSSFFHRVEVARHNRNRIH